MTNFREGETVPPMGEQSIESGGTDDREARVLARAKEIISRQPTPEEIEEAAARRRRNATVEVMPDLATLQKRWIVGPELSNREFEEMRRLEALARIEPPAPVSVTRLAPTGRLDNTKLLHQARQHELELKSKTGGRWTDEERAEWWVLHGTEICEKTDRLVRKNKVGSAIALLVKELAVLAISQTRNRELLEDRVARLEPKPRVRVQAGREVIA